MGDPGSVPGSGRSPGEREWLPTPVFLPQESLDFMFMVFKIVNYFDDFDKFIAILKEKTGLEITEV